jgi:hypothetical protein
VKSHIRPSAHTLYPKTKKVCGDNDELYPTLAEKGVIFLEESPLGDVFVV